MRPGRGAFVLHRVTLCMRRLFGASERERHTAVPRVEELDRERIHLAELQGRAERLFVGEFADMYQSRDPLLDGRERAVLVVLDDHGIHRLILLVLRGGGLPRIFLERFDGERDLVVLNIDDLYFHCLADLVAGLRLLDKRPVHLADVDEAFEAFFELHEHAEFSRSGDDAFDGIAHVILLDERRALGRARTLLREYKFLFLRIGRDDEEFELRADELLELDEDLVLIAVRDSWIMRRSELGSREESLDALPDDDETSLVRIGDHELEGGLLLHGDFGLVPDERLARFAQRELDVAFLLLDADDLGRDDVADIGVLEGLA